jgi:hypothetical protein
MFGLATLFCGNPCSYRRFFVVLGQVVYGAAKFEQRFSSDNGTIQHAREQKKAKRCGERG